MSQEMALQDVHECQQLVAAYCQLIDHGEATKTADLFTNDAVLQFTKEAWIGRERIREGMKGREAMGNRISRHVCNNFFVTSAEEGRIAAITTLTLYRADVEEGERIGRIQGAAVLGEYADTFVRTPAGWRISRRICRIDLAGPE